MSDFGPPEVGEDAQDVSPEAQWFDSIIEALQDILMDEAFQQKQDAFYRTHCADFTRDEENKLSYTPIHNKFVAEMEQYIEQRLQDAVQNFDMAQFMDALKNRGEAEVPEGVWDLLLGLTDFVAFKEDILDFKEQRMNAAGGDPFADLQIGTTALRAAPS
eukprot:NODE_6147_length_655_cov_48.693182_g6124_i0.p1 GENE.NODE_6147_length_655_cov_48.693182_g6124_i0~~NODE_6147_length_655_cov_48.693182_g6124_i0.p1  ORF type:complete len:160 (-),score=30.31 NODE_6147_length_655_cov_48.693182_g6124_i0:100-579(-)